MTRAMSGGRARKMKKLLLSVYGAKCYKCGKPIDLNIEYPDPFSFSIGHQQAVSKGGNDSVDNLRPEHLGCNIKAGNRGARQERLSKAEASFF